MAARASFMSATSPLWCPPLLESIVGLVPPSAPPGQPPAPNTQAAEIDRLRARIAQLEEEVQAGREAEEMLRGVFATVPAIIVQYDRAGRIKSLSRMQPGFDRDKVIGTMFSDYVPANQVGVIKGAMDRAWKTGQPQHYEIQGDGPNGAPAYYQSYLAAVRDRDGVMGIMLVAIDVTAQRSQALALKQSESMLQLALEVTGMGLWVQDLATKEVTWNDNAHRIFGHARPLDAETYINTLAHPDDRALLQREYDKTLEAGRVYTPPHRIVRPDGSVRWVASVRQVVSDEHGRPTNLIGGTQDITEQYESELRQRHAQRMEAVGELTAGIAHNFNNMLAAIVPALDLMTPALPQGLAPLADGAMKAASRATAMVRQLMTFAGKRIVPAQPIKASEAVNRALAMCQTLFEQQIILKVHQHEDLTLFLGPSDLEQALVNVLLNARDALLDSPHPERRIDIHIGRFEGEPSDGYRVCGSRGVYGHIAISDTGMGMTEDVRVRVFEPFFTTKEVGRGTGLGLAMAYAVVNQAGGCVTCRSGPGRGTTFELFLPLSSALVAAEPTAVPLEVNPKNTNRIVLVVEDEDTVAAATVTVLRQNGLQVHHAKSLDEALRLAAAHPQTDLVMLDRSLPGGPADKIVADLRRLLPHARIAFFTGQDLSETEAHLVDAVLLKPLAASELLAYAHAPRTVRH